MSHPTDSLPFDPTEFGFVSHGTTEYGTGWMRGKWTICYLDGCCEIGKYEDNGEFDRRYLAQTPRTQGFARDLFEHLGFMKIDLEALSQ